MFWPWYISFRMQCNYKALFEIVCYTAVFSVVTQRSVPQAWGALRDDTKNGFVADYVRDQHHRNVGAALED